MLEDGRRHPLIITNSSSVGFVGLFSTVCPLIITNSSSGGLLPPAALPHSWEAAERIPHQPHFVRAWCATANKWMLHILPSKKMWAEIFDWKRMHWAPTLFVYQEVDLQETCICLPPKYFGQKFWIESGTVEELDNGSGGTLLSLAATGRHPPHAELPHCVKMLRSIWLNKIVVQDHTYMHCTPDCYDKTIGYYTLAIIEIHSTQYIHCTHCNNILTCWCTACGPCLATYYGACPDKLQSASHFFHLLSFFHFFQHISHILFFRGSVRSPFRRCLKFPTRVNFMSEK